MCTIEIVVYKIGDTEKYGHGRVVDSRIGGGKMGDMCWIQMFSPLEMFKFTISSGVCLLNWNALHSRLRRVYNKQTRDVSTFCLRTCVSCCRGGSSVFARVNITKCFSHAICASSVFDCSRAISTPVRHRDRHYDQANI